MLMAFAGLKQKIWEVSHLKDPHFIPICLVFGGSSQNVSFHPPALAIPGTW